MIQRLDKIFPNLAIIRGNLGVAVFNIGENDTEAKELLLTSIEVMNLYEEVPFDYYNILYNLASLRVSEGDFNTALNEFLEIEDFYAYDAENDQWLTGVPPFPAGPRTSAVSFTIDGKGYVGTGGYGCGMHAVSRQPFRQGSGDVRRTGGIQPRGPG